MLGPQTLSSVEISPQLKASWLLLQPGRWSDPAYPWGGPEGLWETHLENRWYLPHLWQADSPLLLAISKMGTG